MKRILAFLAVLLLIVCLSAGAFADNDSNPGGEEPTPPVAPTTGYTIALAALGFAAVGGGTVFAVTRKKSK